MYIYGSYRKIKTGVLLFGPPCMLSPVRLPVCPYVMDGSVKNGSS